MEFDVDDELGKLFDPTPVLTKADFVKMYGFKDEGYLPNRLTKWEGKRFDDQKCVALFGPAVGPAGRYGYNWNEVKSLRIRKRIKELFQALYQRGATRVLFLIKWPGGLFWRKKIFRLIGRLRRSNKQDSMAIARKEPYQVGEDEGEGEGHR